MSLPSKATKHCSAQNSKKQGLADNTAHASGLSIISSGTLISVGSDFTFHVCISALGSFRTGGDVSVWRWKGKNAVPSGSLLGAASVGDLNVFTKLRGEVVFQQLNDYRNSTETQLLRVQPRR